MRNKVADLQFSKKKSPKHKRTLLCREMEKYVLLLFPGTSLVKTLPICLAVAAAKDENLVQSSLRTAPSGPLGHRWPRAGLIAGAIYM